MSITHVGLMLIGMGIVAIVLSYACVGAVKINDHFMEKKDK